MGYIDRAIVGNMFRVRFDAAYGNPSPDRSEFFYAKCGCFGLGSDSPGPPRLETSVDYQLLQADVEYVLFDGVSAFFEAPVRFMNPEQNDNTAGFGDLQAGFKLALWECHHRVVTFQLRTYVPTGDADRGLGTEHAKSRARAAVVSNACQTDSNSRRSSKIGFLMDGSSSAGTSSPNQEFSGNVLRYGVGLGYDLFSDRTYQLTPVAEFVGWTLIDGFGTVSQDGTPATTTVPEVDGDTIVNFKIGSRLTFGGGHSILRRIRTTADR